ncbi:hypothetical protein FRAAL0732 [Frankia alni ACN14a]|uniref:Uncharacterized protein n=1 Tax=Frankia alni (strain DSM 45986 / CECT 9034 / ACN14a) TaxID=326424 RepID=Q0RSQ5_FRAAA|nr:hypothetical protein FRAAL0732 [Frankia alni ACN14a]
MRGLSAWRALEEDIRRAVASLMS